MTVQKDIELVKFKYFLKIKLRMGPNIMHTNKVNKD